MGVVSKSGSGGISRICPPFPPTTDIRRGERHVWLGPFWEISFEHLVGATQEGERDVETESLCRFKIEE